MSRSNALFWRVMSAVVSAPHEARKSLKRPPSVKNCAAEAMPIPANYASGKTSKVLRDPKA